MELQNQVKQALKQLPPAERVVAFALKGIYQKIKNLHDKQEIQINQVRQQFLTRYKKLEQNTSEIINGKKLTKQELASPDQFFVEQQKKELDSLLQTPTSVKDYWLVALKNSRLNGLIKPLDEKIISHLTKLEQKVSTQTVEIFLTFNGSSQVQNGTYNVVTKLQNGIPISFKGLQLKIKQPLKQGLLFQFNEKVENGTSQKVLEKFQMVIFIINDFIPYSLRYFLGQIYEGDDEQEDEEDDDDEEDEQEQQSQQDQKPRKK